MFYFIYLFHFQRKILAMYLHHDSSVLSNVFCTQLLGFESVMQMLESNFVLWGWDLTYDTNRVRLLNSMTRTLGSVAAVTVRNIPTDKLPAIILIMKIRSSTNIYSVIYGENIVLRNVFNYICSILFV